MKLRLGEARVEPVQVLCHAVQVFLFGVLCGQTRWPLRGIQRTSLHAIPMDTLFTRATLEIVGLFEGHGRRFDVFDSDGNRVACLLYFTLINIMRHVVFPMIFHRPHLKLTLFQSLRE